MNFYIRFFGETFVADFADVRLRVQMRVHVDLHSFDSLKPLAALFVFALVRLLTSVDHLVGFKLTPG